MVTAREILKETHSKDILLLDNIRDSIMNTVRIFGKIRMVCSKADLEEVLRELPNLPIDKVRRNYSDSRVMGITHVETKSIIVFVNHIVERYGIQDIDRLSNKTYNTLFHEMYHLSMWGDGNAFRDEQLVEHLAECMVKERSCKLKPAYNSSVLHQRLGSRELDMRPLMVALLTFLLYRILIILLF